LPVPSTCRMNMELYRSGLTPEPPRRLSRARETSVRYLRC
jgi:hypothetical protein